MRDGALDTSLADTLAWPFFDDRHRACAAAYVDWAEGTSAALVEADTEDDDAAYGVVQRLVGELGRAGLLRACVPGAYGGLRPDLDVRTLCLARDALARSSALADFAFAMQGLGSVPIALFGSEAQKAAILPDIAAGRRIGAFALSEPEAGSDVAALATTATRTDDGWRLDGVKTWISNAGIATQYVLFARTGEAPGSKGLSAFVVAADALGLDASERIVTLSPHPLGSVRLRDCRVPHDALIGQPGQGFRIAMATLDVFRSTVGAAALGLARRALDEALGRSRTRALFGAKLGDLPLAQAKLGEMAMAVDASALLVYRAAWTKDVRRTSVTREASMAKVFATESAQQVIDDAVQLFGGLGVTRGSIVERLYRDVRALRIYEGATDVLKLVIGQRVLAEPPPSPR